MSPLSLKSSMIGQKTETLRRRRLGSSDISVFLIEKSAKKGLVLYLNEIRLVLFALKGTGH